MDDDDAARDRAIDRADDAQRAAAIAVRHSLTIDELIARYRIPDYDNTCDNPPPAAGPKTDP